MSRAADDAACSWLIVQFSELNAMRTGDGSMVNAFSSASELATAIRLRRVSAAEVTEMYLARIATHNPALNAVVTLDEAGARARAGRGGAGPGGGGRGGAPPGG